MSHPLTDTPRLRPALRVMIRALLALFLVAVAALVIANRGAMGGIGPVILAAAAVFLLVVAPLVWESVMTSRAVKVATDRKPVTELPVHIGLSLPTIPAEPAPSRRGKRAWTAPRPSIWTQQPQPRDWFAHNAPRLSGWEGGSNANLIADPGASLK